MIMDQIDEENPINSFKNSFLGIDDRSSNAMRRSLDDRSSVAKDFVQQLIGMEKNYSKEKLPFGDSFEGL